MFDIIAIILISCLSSCLPFLVPSPTFCLQTLLPIPLGIKETYPWFCPLPSLLLKPSLSSFIALRSLHISLDVNVSLCHQLHARAWPIHQQGFYVGPTGAHVPSCIRVTKRILKHFSGNYYFLLCCSQTTSFFLSEVNLSKTPTSCKVDWIPQG